MSPPRLAEPGRPVHVIHRGNNRGRVFYTPHDAQLFLDWLGEAAATYDVAVHAYVLMTNHVHLLMTPKTGHGLSRVMQSVGTRYTRYINATQDRSGTLWEGRYRAAPITSDRYFLACQRYIELNPVRAGVAKGPASFRWSSYKANAENQPNALLTPHDLYTALGKDAEERAAAYRALLDEAMDTDTLTRIRTATQSGFAIGDTPPPQRGRPRRKIAA